MNFKKKSGLAPHTKGVNGQWTGHYGDDVILGGEGADMLSGDDVFATLATSWGQHEEKPTQYTANSIALRADYMSTKCLRHTKKSRQTCVADTHRRNYKSNRILAVIKPARSAIRFVVKPDAAQNTSEVSHG